MSAPHGSYTAVWAHRRAGEDPCPPCLDARRRYLRRRHKLRQMGRPGYIPLDRLDIAKVRLARRYGWTYQTIADTLGCSLSTVWRIEQATAGDMARAHTIGLLRAWTEPQEHSQPTGIGTLRRIQALMWCGYSGAAIAVHAGISAEALNEGVKAGRTMWSPAVRAALADAYDHLCSTPPRGTLASISRSLNAARTRGYAPPAAWDDIDDASERAKGIRDVA